MARMFKVKGWERFQHYKDRNPPWIKLHLEILASEDWVMLADASKLVMIACMMVASKHSGQIPDNPGYIKRFCHLDKVPDITPLIECGFLEPLADASKPEHLVQNARPEKEAEKEAEQRNKKDARASRFDDFWKVCPKKVGKGAAKLAFVKALKTTTAETLIGAMARYGAAQVGKDETYIAHPKTWLTHERWLDETGPPQSATIHVLSDEVKARELENLKNFGVI